MYVSNKYRCCIWLAVWIATFGAHSAFAGMPITWGQLEEALVQPNGCPYVRETYEIIGEPAPGQKQSYPGPELLSRFFALGYSTITPASEISILLNDDGVLEVTVISNQGKSKKTQFSFRDHDFNCEKGTIVFMETLAGSGEQGRVSSSYETRFMLNTQGDLIVHRQVEATRKNLFFVFPMTDKFSMDYWYRFRPTKHTPRTQ